MPGPGELFTDGVIILVALWGGRINSLGDRLGALFRRPNKAKAQDTPPRAAG